MFLNPRNALLILKTNSTLICERCKIHICYKCLTGDHNGHLVEEIQANYMGLKNEMSKDLELMKLAHENMKSLVEDISRNERVHKEAMQLLDNDISVQETKLQGELETLFEENRSTLKEMNTNNNEQFRKQRSVTEKRMVELTKQIQEHEREIRCGNHKSTLKFSITKPKTKDLIRMPKFEESELPVFLPGKIAKDALQVQYGKIVLQSEVSKASKTKKEIIQSKQNAEVPVKKPQTQKPSAKDKRKGTLMKKFNLTSGHITVGVSCLSVAVIGPERAWTKSNATQLELVDQECQSLDTAEVAVNLDAWNGIAVHPSGDLLITDNNNCCVLTLDKENKLTQLFRTGEMNPCGLCCLQNGDILIAFCDAGTLSQYSFEGKMMKKIGQSVLKGPMFVCINKVTMDICVSDIGNISNGKVSVFLKSGKHRFNYTGTQNCPLNARDLCSDSMGHILITDITHGGVQVIDRNGQFIRYFEPADGKLTSTRCIDVDEEGNAWVGSRDKNKSRVYVMRYVRLQKEDGTEVWQFFKSLIHTCLENILSNDYLWNAR